MKPRILAHEPTEKEIQHAAFLLWEEQGRPANRDVAIWLTAKQRLKHSLHVRPAATTRPTHVPQRSSAVKPATANAE